MIIRLSILYLLIAQLTVGIAQSAAPEFPAPQPVVFQQLPTIIIGKVPDLVKERLQDFLTNQLNKHPRYRMAPFDQKLPDDIAKTHSLQMTIFPVFRLNETYSAKDTSGRTQRMLYKYAVVIETQLKIVDLSTGEVTRMPTLASWSWSYARMNLVEKTFVATYSKRVGSEYKSINKEYKYPSGQNLDPIWEAETTRAIKELLPHWRKRFIGYINYLSPPYYSASKATKEELWAENPYDCKLAPEEVVDIIYRKPYSALGEVFYREEKLGKAQLNKVDGKQLIFTPTQVEDRFQDLVQQGKQLHLKFLATFIPNYSTKDVYQFLKP